MIVDTFIITAFQKKSVAHNNFLIIFIITIWITEMKEGNNRVHADALSTAKACCDSSLSPIFVSAGAGLKKGYTDRVIRECDIAPTIAIQIWSPRTASALVCSQSISRKSLPASSFFTAVKGHGGHLLPSAYDWRAGAYLLALCTWCPRNRPQCTCWLWSINWKMLYMPCCSII